jgi:hypothetical protein
VHLRCGGWAIGIDGCFDDSSHHFGRPQRNPSDSPPLPFFDFVFVARLLPRKKEKQEKAVPLPPAISRVSKRATTALRKGGQERPSMSCTKSMLLAQVREISAKPEKANL